MNTEIINDREFCVIFTDGRMPYVLDCTDKSFFAIFINNDSQIKIIGRNMHYPNSASKMIMY